MRLLLDTNILIPLEDSRLTLKKSLANLVRLAHANGHELVFHPASEDDIRRDPDQVRQQQTLDRLHQYTRLEQVPLSPENTSTTGANDRADNEILYALVCEAVHALITEDRGIHDKATARGLVSRVYTIQTAEDWLKRLHEKQSVSLPNIENMPLHSLTPNLSGPFFDSLREGYGGFDDWFRRKARDGRTEAWVFTGDDGALGAICIYTLQNDEVITQDGMILPGPALKLSTFKVDEPWRGRKIGELFLKAAFRYATLNRIENIFVHGDKDGHHFLFELLQDFGFTQVGTHPGSNGRDAVYLKRHPLHPPSATNRLTGFEFFRLYYPHFQTGLGIRKFVVPIRPSYHEILFPDGQRQASMFAPSNTAGNAIKMAYLCHAQRKEMNPGDLVLFYRSHDERAVTSLGVVEQYETHSDSDRIASLVSRRTVYDMAEIREMAKKTVRVMLFRLVCHFRPGMTLDTLKKHGALNGPPQSIVEISNDSFNTIIASRRTNGSDFDSPSLCGKNSFR